jgi:hypothetical protein
MNRAARAAMVIAAIMVGWVAACSDSYSTSTTDDAGAADASTSADGAGPRDGSLPDDAPSATDGGADTDAGDGDGAADACAHTVCESFDDGNHYTMRWLISQAGVATIGATTTEFLSPPAALEAQLPSADAGGVARYAFLSRTFSGTAGSVVVEMDVRLDTFTTGDFNFFELTLQPSSVLSYYTMGLTVNAGSTTAYEYKQFIDGGSTSPSTAFAALPQGAWVHFKLVVALGANATYTVFENGMMVATRQLSVPPYASLSPKVGITFVAEPAAQTAFLYDNVTIDVLP